MRLGIVGNGVVGHATARVFMEHHEVLVYDILSGKATHKLGEVMECDLVFLCLPTPMDATSLAPDVSIIESFCAAHRNRVTPIAIRSTVPVGTTARLADVFNLPGLVHNPEFLTARCAVTDAHLPSRNIVGGPQSAASVKFMRLYRDRFPGTPCLHMSSNDSEAVKYATNTFFAVKVALMNELRAFADKAGIKWENLLAGLLADGRIAYSHTKVPGPDGRRGFGGTCLPKDLAGMIHQMEALGLSAAVCRAAMERNFHDRLIEGMPV